MLDIAEIDRGVRSLVLALNASGWHTRASCAGDDMERRVEAHRPGYGWVAIDRSSSGIPGISEWLVDHGYKNFRVSVVEDWVCARFLVSFLLVEFYGPVPERPGDEREHSGHTHDATPVCPAALS